MIFNIINFACGTLFSKVNATYVEGIITQDTVWTLVDSPFVISKNVTVASGVTLTIEPGVQIRFGENFSLIVSGRLYANGTSKQIIFTSNKQQPKAGEWQSIIFNSAEKSVLIGCSIAYAESGIFAADANVEISNCTVSDCSQNGVTAINSVLKLYNCTIRDCSQNGIDITNSELTLQKSIIIENGGSGISVTGNRLVIIDENAVIANGNGIVLTGDEASNIDISRNIIGANRQAGIGIEAITHDNTVILNNTVTSNSEGFYISTPTSTSITNNSISYNKIGIFYIEGSHEAHFNDIYGNKEKGMDVGESFSGIVDAEHNYWGDPSGPYHESLNPEGRGNGVGGNGVNLDFIFFLANPISHINIRPTAVLLADKLLVAPNEEVTFFATNSLDDGRVDEHFFDFGDGTDSGWTTLSIFTHKYSSPSPPEGYNVTLQVMDDCGTTSFNLANAIITVQSLPSLQVTVDLNNSRVHEGEQVAVTVHVTNGTVPIENATVTLFSVESGDFAESSGLTDANGYYVTTFTAPDMSKLENVRIVARASKTNYNDGSDYEYLEVLPNLSVQIIAEPSIIKSEATAKVSIYVKSNELPIANSSVTIVSSEGILSTGKGVTNSDGLITLGFTAPLTTTLLDVVITAHATKEGYIDGTGETTVRVEPKILDVQVITTTNLTISDAKLNVTVHVEYESIPISGAIVAVSATNGTFLLPTGTTDDYGDVKFTYTAPAVKEQANITIMVEASKTGYANGSAQLEVTVNPRTFNIQISTPNIQSGDVADILVTVICNEDSTRVAGAVVTISSTYGDFSATTKTTGLTGTCIFTFTAPLTSIDLNSTITVNVTKNGYADGVNQTIITISPKVQPESGWSLLTVLLILIPVIIAVVIVVLIKLKIIVISTGEEEQ